MKDLKQYDKGVALFFESRQSIPPGLRWSSKLLDKKRERRFIESLQWDAEAFHMGSPTTQYLNLLL